MEAPEKPVKAFGDGDMDPFVMRHTDKHAMLLTSAEGWIQLGYKDLKEGESVEVSGVLPRGPAEAMQVQDSDILVVVLRGTVDVVGPTLRESLGPLDMFKMPRKGWIGTFTGTSETTLLVVRSDLPHHFDFFFDPKAGVSTPLGNLPSNLMQ